VVEKATRFMGQLAAGPTRAHGATKEIVRAVREGGVAEADRRTPWEVGPLFETDDLRAAVRSFLEQGPGKAKFEGR
jgi:enoyl-CoA hydratase